MDPNIQSGVQLDITIRNPQQIMFAGKANSITSFNEIGPFDILPMHANFITLIRKNITVHQNGKNDVEFPLDEGIMKVFENTINVFLGFERMK